jgi:hypothetical protein
MHFSTPVKKMMKTLIAALLLALASPAHAETPYQEGLRDYREGLCFRARPYVDYSPEQDLWIKGYRAHQTTKIGKRNDEHCFPRNATVKH